MHSRPLIGLLCGTVIALSAAMAVAQQLPGALPAPAAVPQKLDKSRTSYAIGIDIGRSMKRQEVEIDPQVIAQGIADAMAGGKLKMSDEEIRQTLMEMQKAVAAKMPQIIKREGEAFLAENKKKEGVQTTASGLQYKVVHTGNGATPKKTDVVTTHYRGTLLDGTVFDSSYDRNEPAKFPVGRVIKGWTEALQLMKVGDKWRLFIPSDLAYGEGGTPDGSIPPNSVLIFDIELLDVAAPGASTGPRPQ